MLQQEDSLDGRQDALRLDVIAAIVGQDEALNLVVGNRRAVLYQDT